MVRKSYGKMRGSRKKLRVRKKIAITRFLDNFKVGEKVHVDFQARGIVHPKFHGLTGVITDKRGNGFAVKIRNKKASKVIFVKPEHLKKI